MDDTASEGGEAAAARGTQQQLRLRNAVCGGAAVVCNGAAEGIVLVQRPLFAGTQGILKAIAMGVTGSLLDSMGGAGVLLDMAAYQCAETAIISDSIPSIFTNLFDVCTAIDAFVFSYGQCLNHRN